jgi:hypothetical protein
MIESKWSKTEKTTARHVFDMAYKRECKAIAAKLSMMIEGIEQPEDICK